MPTCRHVRKARIANRGAFTLIELLVVVAIIGVLISLLSPSLRSARDSAQRVSCASNLRQMGIAGLMLIDENQGYFPDIRGWAPVPSYGRTGLTHPALPVYLGMTDSPPGAPQPPTILTCLAHYRMHPSPNTPWSRTYAINYYSTGSAVHQDILPGGRPWPTQLSQASSQQAFFLDGNCKPWNVTPENLLYYYTHATPARISGADAGGGTQDFPHNDSMNVVFVDGHVETISREWAFGNLLTLSHPFWRSDR